MKKIMFFTLLTCSFIISHGQQENPTQCLGLAEGNPEYDMRFNTTTESVIDGDVSINFFIRLVDTSYRYDSIIIDSVKTISNFTGFTNISTNLLPKQPMICLLCVCMQRTKYK